VGAFGSTRQECRVPFGSHDRIVVFPLRRRLTRCIIAKSTPLGADFVGDFMLVAGGVVGSVRAPLDLSARGGRPGRPALPSAAVSSRPPYLARHGCRGSFLLYATRVSRPRCLPQAEDADSIAKTTGSRHERKHVMIPLGTVPIPSLSRRVLTRSRETLRIVFGQCAGIVEV